MKILAIRGKNLASLAGEFAIDFQNGPLERANLFAVTGPVGSGKSTLLDALCLALFDRIPRFVKRTSTTQVGHPQGERLGTFDTRQVLRRGTAHGFAQVDFQGLDRGLYRATWSVRRARGKVHGKIQKVDLSLIDLTTMSPIAGGKKEFAEAIVTRLGLTFEQFCRSVLLAQGDFANFLKASEHDRAALLEKMTNSTIYSRISFLAHERARTEAESLANLDRQLTQLAVAEPQERLALEDREQQTRESLAKVRQDLAILEKAAAWFTRCADLKGAHQQAEDQHRRAVEAWESLKSLRIELAGARLLQPLLPFLQRCDDLSVQATRLTREREQQLVKLTQLQSDREAAQHKLDHWLSQRETLLEQSEQIRPELERARQLEGDLARETKALSPLHAQHQAADRELRQCREEQAQNEGAIAKTIQGLEAFQEQITANPAQGTLADEWPRWQSHLNSWLGEYQRLKETRQLLTAVRRACEQGITALANLNTAMAELDAERLKVKERAEQLATELVTAQPERQEQRLRDMEARLRDVNDLRDQATQLLQGVEERARKQQRLQDWTEQLDVLAKQQRHVQDDLQTLRGRLQEVSETLRQLRNTLSLDDYRHELEPDTPCPLCGSIDHPYARQAPVVHQLLQQSETRQVDLEGEQQRLIAHQARVAERYKGLVEQRDQLRIEMEHLERVIEEQSQRFSAALDDDQQLVLDETGLKERCEGFIAEQQKISTEIGTLTVLLETLRTKRAQRDEFQQRLETVRAKLDERDQERRALTEREAERRSQIERLETVESEAVARAARELTNLDPAYARVPNWQADFQTDPSAFIANWSARVAELGDRQQDLARLTAERDRLNARSEALAERFGLVQQVAEERAEAFQTARQREEELTRERAGLLGGLTVASFISRQERDQRRIEDAHEQARQLVENVRGQVTTGQELAKNLQHRREEVDGELEGCRQELERELMARTATLAALRGEMERAPNWFQETEQRLGQAQSKLTEAHTVLTERGKALADLQDQQPELEEALVVDRLQQLRNELEGQEAAWLRARDALTRDDEARTRSQSLLEERTRQQELHDTWQTMKHLIGHSKGDKFRTFAQGLTLEWLLTHANHHLRDLAPRYHLARVPGTDLEIQVTDRDMGDEVRSVYSLSGGEGFLVSLALALGLASLSSHGVPIESLFIDEGFGTLDPTHLEMALAALDALQARGCKVGVISHVPDLIERMDTRVRVIPEGGGRSRIRVESTL